MHLLIVTSGYPSKANPSHFVFVQQFVHALIAEDIQCTVINPISFHSFLKRKKFSPYFSIDFAPDKQEIRVFRPLFFSFSAKPWFNHFSKLNPALLTYHNFKRAVKGCIKRHSIKPDVLYGHFLFQSGATAVTLGREMGIPGFPGVGESVRTGETISTIALYGGIQKARLLFRGSPGVITNSSLLQRMVRDQLNIPITKIGVFPNGINTKRFYSRDKHQMRIKYGFPNDLFLIGCLGHYSYNKGQQRVLEAIQGIDNVGIVFIGGGVPHSDSTKILFNQAVEHEKVPELLSACDIFVLPTLGEGSCNAIVEAMASGLPVISSDAEFNDDLLSDEMSIRVNPMKINEIRHAIQTLLGDANCRKRMAAAALQRSRNFDIQDRVRNILRFMEIHS